jgi:hypothetical protein
MHQIGCVAKDHTAENSAEVNCSLNIGYFLTLEMERVVLTPKHNRDPEKETVHTHLCAEETGCIQCNSGYCPGLPETDMTVHFLRRDTFLELSTQINLLPLCLDTAFFLMIVIALLHGTQLNKSIIFCVLLNVNPDSFRIRNEEEP